MVDIAPEAAVGKPFQDVLMLENVQGDDLAHAHGVGLHQLVGMD